MLDSAAVASLTRSSSLGPPRRPLSPCGAAGAVFLLAAFCLSGDAATAPGADLGTIESKRRIRVLVAVNEDPELFSTGKSGTPGFEREILEGWTRRLQVRLAVTTVRNHAELLAALTEDRGDLAVGLPKTPPALEGASFAAALWPQTQVVVSRKPRAAPANPEELKKVVLGLVDGSTAARSVAEVGVPTTRVLRFPTRQRLVDGLRAGDLDAAVLPLWTFVAARREDEALTGGLLLGGSAWAVDKDSVHLLHALNGHIERVRTSPDWREISARYFGPEAIALMGLPRP
jgi:ABC-type amino acid transport substrate-binding protein